MRTRLPLLLATAIVGAVMIVPSGTAEAEDCGWCMNYWFLTIPYHKFTDVHSWGDLACGGNGCHFGGSVWYCDDEHNACSNGGPPGVDLITDPADRLLAELVVDPDVLAAAVERRDWGAILAAAQRYPDDLTINKARGLAQLRSCSGSVVAQFPLGAAPSRITN